MVGLLILAVVGAYVGLVGWLVTSVVKSNWARAGVVLAALAIPLWDWPIGYANFRQHCQTEGGLKTFAPFPPTTSIFVDRSSTAEPSFFHRHGIAAVEFESRDSVARNAPSKPTSTAPVKLTTALNQPLPWHLMRYDTTAIRRVDGQVIARFSGFKWHGTWWQANYVPFLRPNTECFMENAPLLVALSRGQR